MPKKRAKRFADQVTPSPPRHGCVAGRRRVGPVDGVANRPVVYRARRARLVTPPGRRRAGLAAGPSGSLRVRPVRLTVFTHADRPPGRGIDGRSIFPDARRSRRSAASFPHGSGSGSSAAGSGSRFRCVGAAPRTAGPANAASRAIDTGQTGIDSRPAMVCWGREGGHARRGRRSLHCCRRASSHSRNAASLPFVDRRRCHCRCRYRYRHRRRRRLFIPSPLPNAQHGPYIRPPPFKKHVTRNNGRRSSRR